MTKTNRGNYQSESRLFKEEKKIKIVIHKKKLINNKNRNSIRC